MNIKFLTELLYRHDYVIIPGMGGFLTSYLPAHIEKESNRFYPPSCKLAFNSSLSTNDGILANHIAGAFNISYQEALGDIRKWVDDSFRLMHTGERIILDGIGVLALNADGNLLFEPENNVNFLGNSFGLPSFLAQSVPRGSVVFTDEKHSRVRPWPSKLKHLVPETLKWAAVLAPFIAFTLWGSFNSSMISNYFHSYSGFYSWVRTTPGKTSTLHKQKIQSLSSSQIIERKAASPAGILNEALITYSPSDISYASLRDLMIPQATPTTIPVSLTKVDKPRYFIIGGAFREYSNAMKMLSSLREKGYPAVIIDTTASGMYVISIKGFGRRSEASGELDAIQADGYSSAWIMRKG